MIPGIAESDAIKYGALSNADKNLYRTLFYEKTSTATMLNEVEWSEEKWREYQNTYIRDFFEDNFVLINLLLPASATTS